LSGIISSDAYLNKIIMQNITSIAELKDAIQVLEVEQGIKEQLFKEQLYSYLRKSKANKYSQENFKGDRFIAISDG